MTDPWPRLALAHVNRIVLTIPVRRSGYPWVVLSTPITTMATMEEERREESTENEASAARDSMEAGRLAREAYRRKGAAETPQHREAWSSRSMIRLSTRLLVLLCTPCSHSPPPPPPHNGLLVHVFMLQYIHAHFRYCPMSEAVLLVPRRKYRE